MPVTFQTIAFSIFPPSKGKPGIKLNNAKAKLTEANTPKIAPKGPDAAVPKPIAVKVPNKIKLTKGPAIATQKAAEGVFGSLSKLANPPNINSVIDLTSIP